MLASFTDGTQAEGGLLVGADGRGSVTRTCIFPEARLLHSQEWAVYGHSDIQRLDPAPGAALARGAGLMVDLADALFMAYRDDPQASRNVTWLLGGPTDRKIPAKNFELLDRGILLRELDDLLRRRSPVAADIVAASSKLAPTQVFTLSPLPAWSCGRVALIGDAAHPVQPVTGTGTTFALEDAMYLARMLREHHYLDAFYYLHADRHHRIEEMISRAGNKSPGVDMELGSMRLNSFDINWEKPDDVPLTELVPAPNL
ncbi:FAD-dependent monooxygenase [Crossiella sp. SN42]|uniref:FAD-dependent oxidoreductase n=1 Tax=Crossiella sp. SN42 TaxID=2944808 RepID=UPI00207C413E|nr:FAD-dependent monooxygenase [Crossiella sp. SN42]MCO1580519.1 FAD-dependent monooxygenase [Crossiella sp. SN42]